MYFHKCGHLGFLDVMKYGYLMCWMNAFASAVQWYCEELYNPFCSWAIKQPFFQKKEKKKQVFTSSFIWNDCVLWEVWGRWNITFLQYQKYIYMNILNFQVSFISWLNWMGCFSIFFPQLLFTLSGYYFPTLGDTLISFKNILWASVEIIAIEQIQPKLNLSTLNWILGNKVLFLQNWIDFCLLKFIVTLFFWLDRDGGEGEMCCTLKSQKSIFFLWWMWLCPSYTSSYASSLVTPFPPF